MLLAGPQLASLASDGTIKAPLSHVNASSIDVRIGDDALIETSPQILHDDGVMRAEQPVIDLADPEAAMALRRVPLIDGGFLLEPGQFLLANLVEHLHLPDDISAEFKLRSSVARLGLEHMAAGWIDAGFRGYITLELVNATRNHAIRLHAGLRIGQITFIRHQNAGRYSYRQKGRYYLQGNHPQTSKGVV